MKKLFMYFTTIVTMIAVVLTIVFLDKQRFESSWNNLENKSNSRKIYLQEIDIDSSTGYVLLTQLAEKHNVNIYRSDIETINNKKVSVKSVYIVFEDGVYDKLPLIQGNLPSNKELAKGAYLITDNINNGNTNQAGTLYSYCNQQFLMLRSISECVNKKDDICGEYTAIFKNMNDYEPFVNELATAFNKSSDDISTQTVFYKSLSTPLYYVTIGLIIVSFGLFLLIAVFYTVKQFKKTGICKILGYNNLTVWYELFSPFIITELITATFCIITIKALTNVPKSTFSSIVAAIIATVFISLAIYLTFCLMIKRYTISNLLKNKNPNKLIIKMNYCIRTVLLIIVSSVFMSTISGFASIRDTYEQYRYWDEYGQKYGILNYTFLDEDHSDKINKTHIKERRLEKLYSYLNEQGAVYAKYSLITPSKTFNDYEEYDKNIPSDKQMKIMTININYLNELQLKDEFGDVIQLDEGISDGIFILPESMKGDKTEEKLCRIFRKCEVDSSERYSGKKIAGEKNSTSLLYYYSNKESFFTFSEIENTNNNYTVKYPIFNIITEANATFLQKRDIAGSKETSPLKINIENLDVQTQYENIEPYLKECGLENNITSISSISSIFEEEISRIKNSMKIYALFALFIFIISCWISKQTLSMIVELNRKEFGVKKLLGFSFHENYKGTIIPFALIWLVIILFSWKIASSTGENIKFGVSEFAAEAVIAITDILFLLYQLRALERKNLSILLKEG